MICTFRAANKQAFKAAFVSVLQLAQHLRLSKVGTVSVEGTKLQANASKHAAVSYARAGEMIAQLEVMGFRRFSLRGHAKVALEWTLVCVSYNLKRLFTLKNLARMFHTLHCSLRADCRQSVGHACWPAHPGYRQNRPPETSAWRSGKISRLP
jgi:hypothetical protein